MSLYKTTIGIEVHAELKTRTKMFCDSKNDPLETRPNWNICPVCVSEPGTLPVINKEAVRHVLRVGKAIGGTLADFSEFDRKNYFYPDLPKGFQISQYKYPLSEGGELAGVKITRIHLEEDTARSQHGGKGETFIDFNRAGLPLMELVTEPVLHSAKEAGEFARELQLLLRYLCASDADMERGQMRVEANISVSKDEDRLGTKVEVKNINSFRAMERAIAFEEKRQSELLESGGVVAQETRGWDEDRGVTFSQRSKEDAHDYRYFPEPDLPKLYISRIPEFSREVLAKSLPELPWERKARYIKDFDIKEEDANMFVRDVNTGEFFESVAGLLGLDKNLVKLAVNYISSDLAGHIKNDGKKIEDISVDYFGELIKMVSGNEISSRGAKDILREIVQSGRNPREIAKEKNLFQKSDEGELKEMVTHVIETNEKAVLEYKSGKEASLQYLVGACMRASSGAGNPQIFGKLLREML
ncbi:MAG: Asp-tRNA(Asn)/Glu-tRNA(Gln) amidotransferase GatCAB subunit B [Candidatus Vogelbacteria bacterium CG10_big_fil_rev_8_21_14_0_10_45_14]|uniref:Aspartyl/glutamyl-tRNA(Asn/Gln) amidotransferase subunit B n=1 Tax=Candidatus Vogelbacteria bacterium CG10_big_fil_rev_8_21_14_0_10_45_14 TaxID=1975042 RepID=A0A2H0RIQ1_9BACT|nr:MAG: Asp-tRNA(Asn)/Glu-tRNA(Gln) amidotransferase GatCAB subunit B [Candidatus Vogelbacteria bacterium CG10_big_fil_rev_8_21_14_0_10_45_14]